MTHFVLVLGVLVLVLSLGFLEASETWEITCIMQNLDLVEIPEPSSSDEPLRHINRTLPTYTCLFSNHSGWPVRCPPVFAFHHFWVCRQNGHCWSLLLVSPVNILNPVAQPTTAHEQDANTAYSMMYCTVPCTVYLYGCKRTTRRRERDKDPILPTRDTYRIVLFYFWS